ncbi:MAG: DDE-type integrase/transposase/recombinase, partial [Sulfitobacter sp.]|nr:DDE-type integrase/transposase/recombinase [Sulfitobacter sp.]
MITKESFATRHRDPGAVLKFFRITMRRQGRAHVFVTKKLRSYGAAVKVIGDVDKQETGRWLKFLAEHSHRPFRQREQAMLHLMRMRRLQKFAAIHASIHKHLNAERCFYSRSNYKLNRAAQQFEIAGELRFFR